MQLHITSRFITWYTSRMLGAIALFLKPVLPRSGGLHLFAWPWPSHLGTPTAPCACASPRASCLSTFLHLHYHTRTGFLSMMSLCESQLWQNRSGTIQELQTCTICTASSQLQDTGYTRRDKAQREEGLETTHSTVFQGQCLQAISCNTIMVHIELQTSFPKQQQYWWSQTAFLCLHLIKPVSHCQTLIWSTTK